MAKPQIVEASDFDHLLKITRATTGQYALRNVALLCTLFGTAMKPSDIAALRVDDYLDKKGEPLKDTKVRGEISFNGRVRPLMWVNRRLVNAVDAYLKERVEKHLGGPRGDAPYFGLDPASPLFLAKDGEGFTLRMTTRENGKTYAACASITNLLNDLIAGAGLDGCSTGSARRTFAVRQTREGTDLRSINEILGQSSLTATRELCRGDTVRLSKLVADAI